MLETKDLRFQYNGQSELMFPDIKVNPAGSLLILGNSGVGKTTLLNLLGLILKPDHGSININENNTSVLNAKELTEFRANNIGIIYQKSYFVNALNAEDNILMANYLANKKMQKNKCIDIAKQLGIDHLLKKKVQELSGGEQQRVSIARAMMNNPKVILADEPTSALDDENTERVYDILVKQAQESNAALIIVSHDARLKSKMSNQILLS